MCIVNKEKDKKFVDLRDKYITKLSKENLYEWMKKVPKEIRTFTVKEYITGLKTCEKCYKFLIDREVYINVKRREL